MRMRRRITPREIVDAEMRGIEHILNNSYGKIDETVREALLNKAKTAREVATSFAQEAPNLDIDIHAGLPETVKPAWAERFIRKHLEIQIPILRIEGADDAEIVAGIMDAFRGMSSDQDTDTALRDGARRVVRDQPGIEAVDFSTYQIETVMREAIGLDGRVPERERSRALCEKTARMFIDATFPQDDTPEP